MSQVASSSRPASQLGQCEIRCRWIDHLSCDKSSWYISFISKSRFYVYPASSSVFKESIGRLCNTWLFYLRLHKNRNLDACKCFCTTHYIDVSVDIYDIRFQTYRNTWLQKKVHDARECLYITGKKCKYTSSPTVVAKKMSFAGDYTIETSGTFKRSYLPLCLTDFSGTFHSVPSRRAVHTHTTLIKLFRRLRHLIDDRHRVI